MWKSSRSAFVSLILALSLGLASSLTSADANATTPCEPNTPCHNNFGEPIALFVLAADGYGFGLVSTIGNGVSLGRAGRPGAGWLTVGYIAAVENLALGFTWTSLGGSSLAQFSDDSYARLQVGLGATHLVFGAATLGVTIAAHARRLTTPMVGLGGVANKESQAWIPRVWPSFAPAPGGGVLTLSGAF